MNVNDCVFCRIIKKEITAKIIFEDDDLLAFHDISPIAPVHIIIIPKKHLSTINEISQEDEILMGRLIFRAKELAAEIGISEGGYKLLFRTGKDGGQEIEHIHLHLIGGGKLYEEIRLA